MVNNNYSYADIWSRINGMEAEHQQAIKTQLRNRILGGVALENVSEILTGAPVEFKEECWALWASKADVSGYHLKDILALSTTETMECVYPIISRWARTAKLSRYSVKDMQKMAQYITNSDDHAAMWRNWASTADFRRYRVKEIADLMWAVVDYEAQKLIGRRWILQVGARGGAELKALTPKDIDKINAMQLPAEAIGAWTAAMGLA